MCKKWVKSTAQVFALGTLFLSTSFGEDDAALFDNSYLQDIRLTIPPSDWQQLRANYLLNDYYQSDFAWNGTTLSRIGIRSRGSGSRSPEKPNLTVKFNKYIKQKLLGLNEVTLKANNQDPSMMREFLTMSLMQRLGLPAPREAPVKLFINDEFFGLYTIVEAVNEDFLKRTFGESAGYLYDFNSAFPYHFEYLGEDGTAYAPLFEPKTHEDAPDWPTLIEAIRVVNQSSDAEFAAAVLPYIDLNGYMDLVAVENYVADVDGILSDVFGVNNFYLYRFGTGTVSTFIPWDTDYTFAWAERSILQNIERVVLSRRAFAVPSIRAHYLATMAKAVDEAGGKDGWMAKEIERLYGLIRDAAREDPHKQCMEAGVLFACGPKEFENEVDRLRTFPEERRAFVLESLEAIRSVHEPEVADGAVVGAASNLPILAAGSLGTVYGSWLALSGAQSDSCPLPTKLEETVVRVNGVEAPLLVADPSQINFQVPWETAEGDATVAVSVAGVSSKPVLVPVAAVAPGMFGAFHRADYSPVNSATPAQAGEILVVYATGLGKVAERTDNGVAAPADPLVRTVHAVEATVDGQAAEVLFAGLAPGLAGVYQVNLQLPAGVARPNASLVLKVLGSASPPLAIAIR